MRNRIHAFDYDLFTPHCKGYMMRIADESQETIENILAVCWLDVLYSLERLERGRSGRSELAGDFSNLLRLPLLDTPKHLDEAMNVINERLLILEYC